MPYPSDPMAERSPEEDDRRRRERHAQSPTHGHPYSPVNGAHPQSPYNQYSSRPSTSAAVSLPSTVSPRLGPPPSPKLNGPMRNGATYSARDSGRSTRYDPISEHREGQPGWSRSPYQTRSPKEVCRASLRPRFALLPLCSKSDIQYFIDSRDWPILQSIRGAENISNNTSIPNWAPLSTAIA